MTVCGSWSHPVWLVIRKTASAAQLPVYSDRLRVSIAGVLPYLLCPGSWVGSSVAVPAACHPQAPWACSDGLSGRGWPLWDGHVRSSDAVCVSSLGLWATFPSPRDPRPSYFSSSLNTTFLGRWESFIMRGVSLKHVACCCVSSRLQLVNCSEIGTVFTLLVFKSNQNIDRVHISVLDFTRILKCVKCTMGVNKKYFSFQNLHLITSVCQMYMLEAMSLMWDNLGNLSSNAESKSEK